MPERPSRTLFVREAPSGGTRRLVVIGDRDNALAGPPFLYQHQADGDLSRDQKPYPDEQIGHRQHPQGGSHRGSDRIVLPRHKLPFRLPHISVCGCIDLRD
jgi:hypothetical protein